jgi:hypothetical protein
MRAGGWEEKRKPKTGRGRKNLFYILKRLRQIGGQLGLELLIFTGGGEGKAEAGGVDELAGYKGRLDPVNLVPHHGKADSRKVNPYLVSAPRLGLDLK